MTRHAVRTLDRLHTWLEQGIREPFNGLSHGAGALLAVVGLVALLLSAAGRPWHVVSFAIYGASLVLLFLASCLYHSLRVPPERIRKLLVFDQVAIYVLIAGTYTPICLVPLRGPWGWSLLGVIWGIALTGIALRIWWRRSPPWVPVALYLVMGWLAAIAAQPLAASLPASAPAWLFGGGVAYTVGAVVFASQRPRMWPGRFSSHELWHLFVLGGSACHYVTIYSFVGSLR